MNVIFRILKYRSLIKNESSQTDTRLSLLGLLPEPKNYNATNLIYSFKWKDEIILSSKAAINVKRSCQRQNILSFNRGFSTYSLICKFMRNDNVENYFGDLDNILAPM